jgi:O-antigen/teichoic acid export membrane protein
VAVVARRIPAVARRIPTALSWDTVRRASGRLTWGIADQGMSSLSNFLLSIYVARTLGAVQFGAFTLAFVTYGFAINASRGLAVEPLLVRFSGTVPPTWRRATGRCTGTALLVGLAAGVCALAAALLVGGTTGLAFVALGLTLPGLMLQDCWRYAFFALGRGYHAFINDTIWTVILLPSLVILRMTGHANVFNYVLAWGAAAAVGAAIAPLQARVVPNLIGATEWLSRHRDLGPRYLIENTASSAAQTFRGYSVSSILGLAAVGYIQAANTLLGPLNTIVYGISLITWPEAAKLLRQSPRRLPLFCAFVSAALVLLALACGAILLVALPRGLGHLTLGSLWAPTYPLVLPATLSFMCICATNGALLGLHALGAARRSLRSMIPAAVLVLALAVVGAAVGGALGSMRFVAVACFLTTLYTWWQFRLALRDSGTVPIPSWLWPGRKQSSPAGSS